MFKLFKGEIMKFFRQPTIYILTIVLSVLIALSFLFYAPNSTTSDTYINDVNFEQSTEVIYATFYDNVTSIYSPNKVYNLIYENPNKDSVQDLINFYKANISIKNDNGTTIQKSAREKAEPYFTTVIDAYYALNSEYIIISNIGQGAATTTLDNKALTLYNALNDLQSYLEQSFAVTSNQPTSAILATTSTYEEINKQVDEQIKNVKNRACLPGINELTSSLEAYGVLLDNVQNKYFSNFKNIKDDSVSYSLQVYFENNTYDLDLSADFLNTLFKNYYDAAYVKLNSIQNDLENFYRHISADDKNNIEIKEELVSKISLFYSTGYLANLLTKSQIINQLSLNFEDNLFNQFIGVNNIKTAFNMTQFTRYNFEQNISKYSYLYENNYLEANYGMPFSSQTTSHFTDNSNKQVVNAFDYSYYVLDIFGFIIIIFSVIIASNMIAGEQKDKTLKLLAIRPYSRNQILTSKVLATLFFAFTFIVLSAIISFIVGAIMYGVNLSEILITINASTTMLISPIWLYLIYLLTLFIKVMFYVIFAFAISIIFKSYIASIVINFFCVLLATIGNVYLSSFSFWKFIPFSNLDLFKYFGGGTFSASSSVFNLSYIIPDTSLLFSILITAIFLAIFITVSHVILNKRDIT